MFQRHCVLARLLADRMDTVKYALFLDADMAVINPNHLIGSSCSLRWNSFLLFKYIKLVKQKILDSKTSFLLIIAQFLVFLFSSSVELKSEFYFRRLPTAEFQHWLGFLWAHLQLRSDGWILSCKVSSLFSSSFITFKLLANLLRWSSCCDI